MMFDLETEIQNWIRSLRRNPGFEDGDIEEIELHIRDSIDNSIHEGSSPEEAFNNATASFGQPEVMGNEFLKARTTELTPPKKDVLAHNYSGSNNPLTAQLIMFSNYLKIALRTIRRNKGLSFINLLGMSVGLASVFIIANWAYNEFSFDRFHEKRDRIYRLIEKQEFEGQDLKYLSSMPEWLAGTFEEDISGIVASTGLLNIGTTWFGKDENRFEARNVSYTDNNIFKIFSLNFISGNPGTALQEPYQMVLTESLARRIFNDASPIGKVIQYQDKHPYTVTGVIEDIPGNSHFQADILISMKERIADWNRDNYNHSTSMYLLLEDGIDPASLSSTLQDFKHLHLSGIAENIELQIQPLGDIHLHSGHTMWGQNWKKSDISVVVILLSVGFLIIVISAINYINLSIALINKRFVEFGIKKIAGSSRSSLIAQYFSESMIFLLLSLPISLLLVELINPVLSASGILENTHYIYHQFWFYLPAIGFIAFLSLLVSFYPAYVLTSTRMLDLLKRKREPDTRKFPLSRVLIIAQLTISCTLISYVSYMLKQIDYMQELDVGYSKEAIINFQAGENFSTEYETIKEGLLGHALITELTSSNTRLGKFMWRNCIHFEGESEDDQWTTPYMMVDYNFIDFYGIRIIEGRGFNEDYALDKNKEAFIINESLANAIGREKIIGKKFRTCETDWGEIVGVVQDFNYNSLRHSIEPLAIQLGAAYNEVISVKIRPDQIVASLELLESTWNQYEPDLPFRYTFLDNELKNLYRPEQRLLKIHTIFSFISIILSCIGILGIFISLVELRTKEIGIRKVHGASSIKILVLLSRGTLWNAVLGLILSIPLALASIHHWRKEYAFASEIFWWIFVLSGSIVMILAWITVCYVALHASRRNPIEALRYE